MVSRMWMKNCYEWWQSVDFERVCFSLKHKLRKWWWIIVRYTVCGTERKNNYFIAITCWCMFSSCLENKTKPWLICTSVSNVTPIVVFIWSEKWTSVRKITNFHHKVHWHLYFVSEESLSGLQSFGTKFSCTLPAVCHYACVRKSLNVTRHGPTCRYHWCQQWSVAIWTGPSVLRSVP